MKIAIVYFSGTGNTEKVLKEFESFFKTQNNEVKMIKIESGEYIPTDIDILIIGYPVHAFNAPKIVLDYFNNISFFKEGLPTYIVKTSGEGLTLNNGSSNKLTSILKNKGITIFNEYHYLMPYNIIFRHSDKMAYKMWKTVLELIPLDAKEILDKKRIVIKYSLGTKFVSNALRIEQPGAHIIGSGFEVNNNCIHCGLCEKNCPTKNIVIKNDKVYFKENCMICMRCVFNCPKDAIKPGILNRWKVNGQYSFSYSDNEKCKHPNYCKRSYKKYFDKSNEKINSNK